MSKLNKIKILISFIFLLILFQNCTNTHFSEITSSFKKVQQGSLSDGNGQPYEGKLGVSFYQVLPNYTCESIQSPVAVLTMDFTGSFNYTFNQNDKCAAINQISIDKSLIDYSEYNPYFVGFRDGIFEKKESAIEISNSDNYSEAWCQPHSSTIDDDRYDVVVKFNSIARTAKAELYFRESGNIKLVSPFDVDRDVQTDTMKYSAPGFALQIDRSAPSPEAWWFFPAHFSANINGLSVSRNLNCRVAAGKLLGNVGKVYPKSGRWNDYIKITDLQKDRSHQPEIQCVGNEANSADCFHSGERLAIKTALENCQDLTLEEQLGAFQWICANEPEGAIFYSKGLLQNKSLANLIDALNWRDNSVTIRKSGTVRYQSLPSKWWSNVIAPLPDNSSSGVTETLVGEGTIFVLGATRESAGYIFGSDRQGLLIEAGAELKSSANLPLNCGGLSLSNFARCLVSAYGKKFLWIEGRFSNNSAVGLADTNLNITMSTQNQIVNASSRFARFAGIGLISSAKTAFRNTVSTGNTKYGLYSMFSNQNLFWNFESSYNGETGIFLRAWDKENSFIGLKTHHNVQHGLEATASDDLILSHSSAEDNGFGGFSFFAMSGIYQKLFSVIANKNNWGFWFSGTANGLFSNIAATNHTFGGISIHGNTTGPTKHQFVDQLIFGGNGGVNCTSIVLSPPDQIGLRDLTCTDTGLDGSAEYTGHLSKAKLNLNCVWNSATNEMNCPLWKSPDSAFIAAQSCPADADGSEVVNDNKDASRHYLKSAIEIPHQENGNNNGLCESKEICLYLPAFNRMSNSRGPGLSNPCHFKNGIIFDVLLY